MSRSDTRRAELKARFGAAALEVGSAVTERGGSAAGARDGSAGAARTAVEHGATVVAPDSADAIAELMALCSANGWRVRPAGALTWLGGPGALRETAAADAPARSAAGADPHDADSRDDAAGQLVVSTRRLDRITEHVPADLVIGVEAGISVTAINDALRPHGQWLPLDPAAHDAATIGAVLALGSAGPLRAGHGSPRDMALGIEVVTGDGRRLRFGGRVVKNVAGYDGVRMLTGSAGSLGIITGAWLRLRGLPRADRTVLIPCGAAVEAGAALALQVRDAAACDALELLSPALAAGVVPGAAAEWCLMVRVTGSAAAVDEAVSRVRRVAPGAVLAMADADADAAVAWDRLRAEEATAASHRVAVGLPSALAATLAAIASPDELGDRLRIAAHAADGIVRAWRAETLPAAGAAPSTIDRTATSEDAVRVVKQRLKAAFDPAGILPEVR